MAGEVTLSIRNCQLQWKISRSVILSETGKDFIYSKKFTLSPCVTLRLRLCPNSTFKADSMSIALEIVSPLAEQVCVSTTVGIMKIDGSVLYSLGEVLKFDRSCVFRIAGFLHKDVLLLHDYLQPDGILIIICNVGFEGTSSETTSSEENCTIDPSLVQNLENLFLDELNTDVIIRVKDREFKLHRSILVARSNKFATYFQQNTSESQSGRMEITDYEPDSFKDFFLYLYTGKTDMVTAGNATVLYKITDKFGMNGLKTKCVKCMILSMSIDSICDVLVLAKTYNETGLLRSATHFFIKNMNEIIQSEKWSDFAREHSDIVTELILKTSNKKI